MIGGHLRNQQAHTQGRLKGIAMKTPFKRPVGILCTQQCLGNYFPRICFTLQSYPGRDHCSHCPRGLGTALSGGKHWHCQIGTGSAGMQDAGLWHHRVSSEILKEDLEGQVSYNRVIICGLLLRGYCLKL